MQLYAHCLPSSSRPFSGPLLQHSYHIRRLFPERIFDADDRCQLAVNSQIQMEYSDGRVSNRSCILLPDPAVFVFKDKMTAADNDFLVLNIRRDAMGNDIFHLRVLSS